MENDIPHGGVRPRGDRRLPLHVRRHCSRSSRPPCGRCPVWPPGPGVQLLRYVFYGLAIGAVIAVRLVSRTALKAPLSEPIREYLQRLSRDAIFTSILCEAPAVLGLMLVFLTGVSRDFYYLLFVSLFLAFMYFPRSRTWIEIIRERFPQEGV